MNANATYVTPDHVRLQKVGNGLWVIVQAKEEYTPHELESEIFRFPDLFKRKSKKKLKRVEGM